MEFRHNQLSILTSVPYLNNHNNQQTRTHTLQHREVRLVKYTYVCVYIFIYIYLIHYPSSNGWSHTKSTDYSTTKLYQMEN